jgi:nucleoside-diphosphate-sugar epimerase/alpha-beta hydrolase superfamily lysophospholipase
MTRRAPKRRAGGEPTSARPSACDADADVTRVMTGATGFLGSNFLLRLLQRGEAVVAIARGADADERVRDALERAAASYSESFDQEDGAILTVVVGDICKSHCGIEEHVLRDLRARRPDELWHFAASLHFEERRRDFIWRHNVTGTEHVMRLATELGCRRFVYVSTAYTTGATPGEAAEELHDVCGPFNNAYEESKALAEWAVHVYCTEHGIDYAILRPSIIVGPSLTMRSGGSDTGLYGLMREMYSMRKPLREIARPLVVEAEPDTALNLVPVDWVVADILTLIDTDFCGRRIHHLTTDNTITIGITAPFVARMAGIPPIECIPTLPEDASPIEQMIVRRTEFYRSYFKNSKTFARTLPRRRGITVDELKAYMREYQRELRGETYTGVLERTVIKGPYGSQLCTFAGGQRGELAVVLVNAYGMPVDFMVPLAKRLAERYRVLSWESRGIPNLAGPFDPERVDLGAHASDLETVLDREGIELAHVVGWCTGAQVSLRFAAENPRRVRTLTLLNGSYRLSDAVPLTEFRSLTRKLARTISVERHFAEVYFEATYGRAQDGRSRESATVSAILGFSDPELIHLTSMPFRSVEAIYRYAHSIARFWDEPDHAWADHVAAPALVVTGSRDRIAHPAESREIVRRMPNARLSVMQEGDHFSLYRDPMLIEQVIDFLGSAAE